MVSWSPFVSWSPGDRMRRGDTQYLMVSLGAKGGHQETTRRPFLPPRDQETPQDIFVSPVSHVVTPGEHEAQGDHFYFVFFFLILTKFSCV